MKQQFLVNIPDTFRTYVYENNRKVVPSSAYINVYRPEGESLLISNAAMAIGADGLLSCDLSATDNGAADINYRAVISYVYNSRTYYSTLFYDIVKCRLAKVITDDDVTAELPQLKDSGWRVSGAAEGGSLTTIVDAELKRYEDGYFTGGLACLTDKDETREIADFTASSGTVTAAAFSTAVGAGERYILTRSFSREIQRAFEKLKEKIIRLGRRPELILDPYDLREVHIYYSVAEACKGLMTEKDGLWREMWKEYERKAEETFGGISFKYDASKDGYIASGEDTERVDTLRAGRR